MVTLVQRLLDLHQQLAERPHGSARPVRSMSEAARDRLQREINVTDEQTACPAVSGIDKLVYELYGLTDEEIRIVEGKSK